MVAQLGSRAEEVAVTMPRKRPAAGTPAMLALDRAGVDYTVRAYAHDPSVTSYGEEAAAALGVEAARVHKTLCAEVDGELVVAVVPVSGQLDLKALAAACDGKRARMAEPAAAERATGYVVGGISPLGQRRRLPTVIDDGAWAWPTILVSGGRRGLDLELAPDDLVRVVEGRRAAIGRG